MYDATTAWRRTDLLKNRKALLIFLTPALAGFLIFYLIPFAGGLYYSMLNNAIEKEFTGLSNICSLFANKAFILALKNTFLLTVTVVPLMILFSLTAAYVIKTLAGKFRISSGILRKSLILPLSVPTVSIAFVWQLMFEKNGHLNRLAGALTGLEGPDWLNGPLLYVPVVLIYIWKYSGFNIILFLGALSSVPRELNEAARLDGAGPFSRMAKIILPQIFPVTFLVTLLSIINSFRIFREVYVLCGPYPPANLYLLQHFINNNFTRLNYEKLTSAAYIFAVVVMAFVVLMMRIENKIISENRKI